MEREVIIRAAIADMQGFAELVADAIIRRTQPMRDDISTNEAHKIYGRQWLETMVRNGQVHPHPQGNRMIYSRYELDTARAVDRAYGNAIVSTLKNNDND